MVCFCLLFCKNTIYSVIHVQHCAKLCNFEAIKGAFTLKQSKFYGNMKPKLVALTGAGISAESGFSTFRDANGLWEQYPVQQVATPEGWQADPNLVTDFYNHLRSQLATAEPNDGHRILAELEHWFDVTVDRKSVV